MTIFTDCSIATNIVEEEDGLVSWIATAAGGTYGDVSFYAKVNKEEINIANYESIDIELDYSTVNNRWNANDKNPISIFGGYEDLEYFVSEAKSGTLKQNIKIPSNFAEKTKASCNFDSILGFVIKFDDYGKGNNDGDQLKVHLKNVKFNPKKDADEDKAF